MDKQPTQKQIDACFHILQWVGSCDSDEHGQPLFETSAKEADKYVKSPTNLKVRGFYRINLKH